MTRSRAALVAVWSVAVAGLILVGPATPAALGHSQLVTSEPAAGDVVAVAPTTIRLVFSEPIEAAYTKLDLLDPTGKTIANGVGAPDPADPYSLIAPVSIPADGVYTVDWRALSATDGHTTSGFFTFGVGNVVPPPVTGSTADAGSIHAGHDAATSFLETESRILGDLGLLLAVGLVVSGWLVLRDPDRPGLAKAIAAFLGLAAVGAAGLILLGASGTGLDPAAYIADSRSGQLLFGRVLIGIAGAGLVLWLATRRPRLGMVVAGLAGLGGLVLVAGESHAAAYASPAPAMAIVVHLLAVSVWLGGLFMLAWFAILGTFEGRSLSVLVPRFSALALVAVALILLTGAYSDWIEVRALPSFDDPYSATLLVKVALALGAFFLGAFNYLSGGRETDRRFRPRVVLESGVAIGVLVATGVLASGSPPVQGRPIEIAAVPSSVPPGSDPPDLGLAPGRPGPTRFVVTSSSVPVDGAVELQLERLDETGESRLELRAGAPPGTYAAGGGLLPPDSRWEASVVVHAKDGSELSRTRFDFTLDGEGITAGRDVPPLDPGIAIAAILLLGAALGLAFTLGGGSLPRVDQRVGRLALIAGGLAATILGGFILLGGTGL